MIMDTKWKLLRNEQDWNEYIDHVIEAGENTRYQFTGQHPGYPCLVQTILMPPIPCPTCCIQTSFRISR